MRTPIAAVALLASLFLVPSLTFAQSVDQEKILESDKPVLLEPAINISTIADELAEEKNIVRGNFSTDLGEASVEANTTTLKPSIEALIPPARVEPDIHNLSPHQQEMNPEDDCPSLENADQMSQTQLILRLTHECRYDKLELPKANDTKEPVHVHVRAYLYFLQNLEAHELQFKIHTLLQMRYVDPRLVFKTVSPSRTGPIMGDGPILRDRLWVPHIFLSNERSSNILGTAEKDILTSISPDGTVIISTRIQATLHCWMNLQKFPFDEQQCSTIFESWMYNSSSVLMHWEELTPVAISPDLHMTEYVLLNILTREDLVNADLNDLRHGAFVGNYSSLTFTAHLAREMGFYMLDYFIPSIMIVAISWVSFWLQADQTAPRVTLGCTTMLTFITLATAQSKTLPKVSYIKASEIWFLGCTGFIFASMAEFAFVNVIWRRKKIVELKKVNSKYIIKSTLTPRLARKDNANLQKSHSLTSLDYGSRGGTPQKSFNNYLTVHEVPSITVAEENDGDSGRNGDARIGIAPSSSTQSLDQIPFGKSAPGGRKMSSWTTMTPQEISIWIDKRSRWVFPLAFLIFNIFYWSFVYLL